MATSKTVLKKRISPQNSLSKVCVNHMESEAEFRIIIDGDLLNYCSKCAAHLASNGFQVERITQSRSPIRGKETRSPHSRRRQELTTFLASLRQLERGYTEKVEQSKRVQESYVIEKETIVNFYASMTEYL
jgi:ribosome-binding protein aMBF1 (putative translation factor)